MQMGLIGLGKMGGNMRDRIREAGHTVVGFDTNPDISDAATLAELAEKLTDSPKVVWVMVPDKVVDQVIDNVAEVLNEGDVIIDGGNSKWTHDQPRADKLAEKGIDYLDVGVSGGVWGIKNGYALMVGGDDAVVEKCKPIFDSLKPAGEFGYVHAGGHGAGHFAKMVHNGIEYAIMQSYAEGWELLEAAGHVTSVRETFNSWREGSVIKSWLLDLAVAALDKDEHLDELRGYADDSGEGRWTVEAGIELGVPLPTITDALYARFVSRQEDSPAMKMVAAMRNQFGGHAVHGIAAKPGEAPARPVDQEQTGH